MRKHFIAAILLGALTTTPALAQQNRSGQQQATGQNQQDAQQEQRMAASQQKIRDSLSKAGLSEVRILDAAYLVQATTQDDEMVLMVVDTRGMPIQLLSQQQGSQTPGSEGGTRSQSSN